MQVTNVQDRVTHAVIGGKKNVESFGISESAEFFHILSNALYSDKPLATVREILCNAWDSHIESGIQSIPVRVMLNNDKLIIQDFGAGIHPSMIKEIYGTYGGSTKVMDGRVTGGFGLGSKAPFSYVDHFEVTSCHQGEKTIYKMSLSNAQVGGKPSILTLVQVSTDDTGITVSINLKTPGDRGNFEKIVRKIASMGEMNVSLNGEIIEPVPFSKAPHGFLMMKKDALNEYDREQYIRLRYGNVVYPVDSHPDYASDYKFIREFLEMITAGDHWNRGTNWICIVQADPDTISVTPSRESLSMTEKTITSITKLMSKVAAHLKSGELTTQFNNITETSIKTNWLMGTPEALFNKQEVIPNISKQAQFDGNYLTNFHEMGVSYLSRKYPKDRGFRRYEFLTRLTSLIVGQFTHRGLVQTLRKELLNTKNKEPDTRCRWFVKRKVKLLRQLATDTQLRADRLFIYSERGQRSHLGPNLTPIKDYKFSMTYIDCLPYLRNIIILSHNRTDIGRAKHFPICRHWLGSPVESFVYTVPRHPKKVLAAREFFEKIGMTVIDLTKAQAWEPKDVVVPVPKEVAYKPKKKGLPMLSACLINGAIQTEMLFADTAARIAAPEFVITISPNAKGAKKFGENRPLYFDAHHAQALVRLWGDKGGVVANAPQEAKFMDLGAKGAKEWIIEKLLDEYKTNPLVAEHYSHAIGLDLDGDEHVVLHLCRNDPELRQHFKLPKPTDQRVLDLVALYDHFLAHERHVSEKDKTPDLVAITKLIATWKIDPNTKRVADLIDKSTLLSMFKSYALTSRLSSVGKETPTARKILLLALEG